MLTTITSDTYTAEGPEYILAPSVLCVMAPDGSARLVDLDGSFYGVAGPGAALLRELLTSNSEAAARRLATRHGVGPEQVRPILDAFTRRLIAKGLLRKRRLNRPQRPRRTFLSLFVRPALLAVRGIPSSTGQAWALLALSRLVFRVFGWTRTILAWQQSCPHLAGDESGDADSTARAVAAAVRTAAASHPFPVACKERALACWTLLRWAGAPASLVLGLDFFPLTGHCWCESATWIVSDERERCLRFSPIVRYL